MKRGGKGMQVDKILIKVILGQHDKNIKFKEL